MSDIVPPTPLQRSETWHGLRAGDPVTVEGIKMRSTTWEFVAYVRNERTGAEWVEVVGGRRGDRKMRSFRPDQIFPASGRTRGSTARPSLADAPRLPLG